ncbi:malonyl CoA-ACP transacylase [Salmonella enterica subsp. enterica]|nr:malonyl CoA-ACP transacylase [Salmonella enterica subsp. enterica]
MTQFAFVFPGQGSQSVGMLAEMAANYPIVEETFAEASAALGYDLWALTQQGPAEELNKTWQTQPALLTASVALWRVWQQQGGKMPALMAGHSLGEYSALVCAGVINFADAVRLVEMRGKFMQEAVPEGTGGMSAIIGLDDASIAKACEESAEGQVVSPVNFNSPGQVVIAGHKEAVERAGAACKAAGAKRALPLPVSVPSHCALMKPAADKLAVELAKITFNVPTVPVVNNVDVKCETDAAAIRDALVRQLYNPVQWTKSVEFIAAQGVEHLYEVGPGKVLTGLTKRIVDTLTASALNEPAALSAALTQYKRKTMSFEGKIALVTGASRGIGRAIAETLVARGAKVIGTATSENGAKNISDYLGANGKGLMLNVTDPASIESVLENIRAEFGEVDILVNNAGITRDNLLMRMKDDEWNDIIETNLSSVFRLSKAVMRAMMKKRCGRIITIGSVVGTMGNAGQANYAAAKAGLIGFSKSLAREVASRGITVNVVAPGFIETDMTRALSDDQRAGILAQVPAGRLGGAQEIASAVAFLASDEASYITGETLHVNGGMYMV